MATGLRLQSSPTSSPAAFSASPPAESRASCTPSMDRYRRSPRCAPTRGASSWRTPPTTASSVRATTRPSASTGRPTKAVRTPTRSRLCRQCPSARPVKTSRCWYPRPSEPDLHTPDVAPEAAAVLEALIELGDRSRLDGMSRYAIRVDKAIGVSIPKIRQLARRTGRNHDLAAGLWASGIHEARILAGLVDEPEAVTPEQMDSWVAALDSWDVCDQTMTNLFSKTRFARERALEWSRRTDEFGKRAGFSLMAALAVRDKAASDASFSEFFAAIERESDRSE